MTLTINLPEPLTNLLEEKATRLRVSVDELATQLLSEAILDEETDLLALELAEAFPSKEEIRTSSKALPRESKPFQPAERAHDLAYIDWLLANPPEDTVTAEEWERLWPQIEQEIEAIDRIQKINKEHM